MAWILVPCLVTLRDEFNRLAPNRDKASDGSVGDLAHASSSSDHNPDETGATPSEDADRRNEVHAIDTDDDLRLEGWDMNRALGIIISRHRNGLDNRLQNVIYNRRIWSRSWGWTARAYNGANAHTQHAHFSARYTDAAESNTKPWGLLAARTAELNAQKEKDEVALATDKIKLTKGAAQQLDPTGKTYKEGQEIDGQTAINLLLIHASRGGVSGAGAKTAAEGALGEAKTAVSMLTTVDGRLGTVEDWINRIGDPSTDLAQVSQTLKALWGQDRARALGLLLSQ